MFSIVLPVFDPYDRFAAAAALAPALESVLALAGDWELILVNNNPLGTHPRARDALRSFARSWPDRVKLAEPDRNAGTAGGFNIGANLARAGSPYLVFMSQDAELVDNKTLAKSDEALRRAPRVAIAHPRSVFEDVRPFNASRRVGLREFYRRAAASGSDLSRVDIDRIRRALAGRTGLTVGFRSFPLTFAILRRSAIEDVGSFDERFGMGCHENDDLAFRALRKGWAIARLEGVVVNHRRLTFRGLAASTAPGDDEMPHSDALRESTRWWKEKWGKPYQRLYVEWRYGRWLSTAMIPYFVARRLAGAARRRLLVRGFRSAP